MKSFAPDNDALWKISTDESHLKDFIRPYVGSGLVGTRFGGLLAANWSETPLPMFSKFVYDDGVQSPLPSWLHLDIRVGGVLYAADTGRHRLVNTLDLLTGIVSLEDEWEYRPGNKVHVSMRLALLRQRAHCGLLTLRVRGLDEPCHLTFGLNGAHLSEKFGFRFQRDGSQGLLGQYTTQVQQREAAQGLWWKSEPAHLCRVEIAGGSAKLTLLCDGPELHLTVGHSVHGAAQGPDSSGRVRADLQHLSKTAPDTLFEESAHVWKKLWERALAYESDDAAAVKMIVAHQFYLLGSLGPEALPLGALGLSKNGWNGSQLWDADFWMYRAILPLWPELAEPLVRYRFLCLDQARQHAARNGYRGAWFPWMTFEDGEDKTHPHYRKEIHLGIWIALAAWEYFQHTRDAVFLGKVGWPLLSDIARFYCSWAKPGDGGRYHIRDVIGPDEALTEFHHGSCDDHFTTVFGIKRVLAAALACARELQVAPDADWAPIEAGLYLPQAGPDGILPEYTGYSGKGIKQADLILSYYPFDYPADAGSIRRNIDYYNSKIMAYGPTMNSQIESCILMQLGDKKEGIERLFRTFREFVRGPHLIPFECRDNDNSFMLTGVGGALQALIYGYYGATVTDDSAIPRIGSHWLSLD